MSALPYEQDTSEQWQQPDEDIFAAPGRPRRRFWSKRTAALLAIITCAAGFYAGIRVEKGQLSSSSSSSSLSLPAALRNAGAGSRAAGRSGSSTGGALRGGGAFPGFGGNSSIGTVASVNGNTIYLTDTSGNTVKVKLSSATKITKSLGVSKQSVRPGDSVVIQGLKHSNGTVTATSVSDSGHSSTSASTGASNSSGSTTSSTSSAVNSLFRGG